MSKRTPVTVAIDPQQFAAMTASEIIRYIQSNHKTAIVGDVPGVDRHIISYTDTKDWLNYQNPFTK